MPARPPSPGRPPPPPGPLPGQHCPGRRPWRVLDQHLLPHHLLSRIMLRLTRVRARWFKNWQIRWFLGRYPVDPATVSDPDPEAWPDFNSFFTRPLPPGARPVVDGPGEAASPVDGTVSQAGDLEDGLLLQAKGCRYALEALLAGTERARPFRGGTFATLYLAPRDYHRVHMPLDGRLLEACHVPGRLFSVSPRTTEEVPGLFVRNERLVTVWETEAGPMALVLVGALFVAGIETVWTGPLPRSRRPLSWRYSEQGGEGGPRLARGQELGRFNMGSTVIVLFPPERARLAPGVRPGARLRMGELLARVRTVG